MGIRLFEGGNFSVRLGRNCRGFEKRSLSSMSLLYFSLDAAFPTEYNIKDLFNYFNKLYGFPFPKGEKLFSTFR